MITGTECIHLMIVWPAAMAQLSCIPELLAPINAKILHGIEIHPNPEVLRRFISGIYSGSQYDRDRIHEKEEGILTHLNGNGIAALFFTVNKTSMKWDDARGRYIYPNILRDKDDIRHVIESNLQHLVSIYETIHITDDIYEFSNDFSELMRMTCVSPCRYIDSDDLRLYCSG